MLKTNTPKVILLYFSSLAAWKAFAKLQPWIFSSSNSKELCSGKQMRNSYLKWQHVFPFRRPLERLSCGVPAKSFSELVQWFGMFSNPHNDLRKSFCSSCLMWEARGWIEELGFKQRVAAAEAVHNFTSIEIFSHFPEYLSSDSQQTASIIIIWQTNVKYEVVLCNVHANYEKWFASMKVKSRNQAGELYFNILRSLSLLILQQVILQNKWFCFIPRLPEFVCKLLKYFKSILFRKFLSC